MSVRIRRLQSDHEQIKQALRNHPAISIRGVAGSPPDRYQIEFKLRSLVETADGRIVERNEHVAEIYLTLSYPRQAPQCRMLTPVFHPNIAPHAICIGDHWAAGESLINLIVRIGEMLAYQSYNVKSPLNGAAARWVEDHAELVPTDPRDLSPSVWAQPESSVAAENQCRNCQAENKPLTRCVNGHTICEDCLVRCSRCGKEFCLLCRLESCPECGRLICGDCRTSCPQCGRTVCAEHLQPCSLCGQEGCSDCTIECSQCGAAACLAHVRQCSACHQPLCTAHAETCADCNNAVCSQHARQCELCGKSVCPDCIATCSQCGAQVCMEDVAQCGHCKAVLCRQHAYHCGECGGKFCHEHFDHEANTCAGCAMQAVGKSVSPDKMRMMCVGCNARLLVPKSRAGQPVQCPKCGFENIAPGGVY